MCCAEAFRGVLENLGGVPGAVATLAEKMNTNHGVRQDLLRYCPSDDEVEPEEMLILARKLQDQVHASNLVHHKAVCHNSS